jgi:hypothetical protein
MPDLSLSRSELKKQSDVYTVQKDNGNVCDFLHVCTVRQQYQSTFLLFQTDAHNYKIIGILKQTKFQLSLRHVSVHPGIIIRELFHA